MPRIIVVTGSSGGIGRASAIAFAARGDTVVLVARGAKGLAGAAAQVERAGGTAHIMPADVADPDQVFAAAEQRRGRHRPDRRVGQRRVHLGVRPVRPDHPRPSTGA